MNEKLTQVEKWINEVQLTRAESGPTEGRAPGAT